MGLENRKEAKTWFDFFSVLQEKPVEAWSEDIFKVFNLIKRYQPERIFGRIIKEIPVLTVVHSTKRGRALGGTRILVYQNMANAFRDALKLSSAMTYKAIWARLPLGGGKTVIFASPKEISKGFLKEYAYFLNEINEKSEPKIQFLTGEDVGFSEEFTDVVAKYTRYIAGKSVKAGGLGDPSPKTAEGIFLAAKAIVEQGEIFTGPLQQYKTAAVMGAGKVGLPLIEMLLRERVRVYFSDTDEGRVKIAEDLGAQRVEVGKIFRVPCHILMPCAIGGVINKDTIPLLSPMCRVVIGAANNILDTPEDGVELHRRRIYFAPDYVVNRWGLEWVHQESRNITDKETAENNLTDIQADILKIIKISRKKDVATSEIADTVSKKILEGQAKTVEEAFEQF